MMKCVLFLASCETLAKWLNRIGIPFYHTPAVSMSQSRSKASLISKSKTSQSNWTTFEAGRVPCANFTTSSSKSVQSRCTGRDKMWSRYADGFLRENLESRGTILEHHFGQGWWLKIPIIWTFDSAPGCLSSLRGQFECRRGRDVVLC